MLIISRMAGLVFLLAVLVAPVACSGSSTPWETVAFKVDARDAYRVSLSLDEGWRLEYRFTSDLDIDFYITDPLGGTVVSSPRTTAISNGRYVAGSSGVYRLVFENGFSLFTGKSVTLTYLVVG